MYSHTLPNIIFAEKPRESIDITLERSNNVNIINNYITDESRVIEGYAEEVVFPRNEKQISEILKEANSRRICVTISGGGTGITGSRVPLGGIVLSTDKMTQLDRKYLPSSGELIEYIDSGRKYSIFIGKDEEGFYAITPPGIPIGSFKRIVEGKGLCYPPDPTETTAFLGGTVATNASGSRTFYYGPTRDYVRRLRVVLPNGDVLDIRRGRVFARENKFIIVLTDGRRIEVELPSYKMPNVEKNAAGYYINPNMDLIDLFIGSEGTLGVISEIEIKLIKKPKDILPVFAHFSCEEDAVSFAKKLREVARKGELPVLSIEFFDKYSVDFMRKKYPPPTIPSESNGIIFFEEETGSEEESVIIERTIDLVEKYNAIKSMIMDLERAKEIRHALPEEVNKFVRSHGTHKVATDICTPEETFDEMMRYYHEVGDEVEIPYVIFGHIGNFHLHFNFLPRNREELKIAVSACTKLLEKAVKLGGTISGEHGVGKKYYLKDGERRPYIELMYGERGLIEMAKLKHAFDPNHILNVGNIIPEEYLEKV